MMADCAAVTMVSPSPSPSPSPWWSWHSPVLLLSLIPCLSKLVWRPNLQHLQLHHMFGRRLYRRVRWLAAIVDPDLSITINEHESTGLTMRRSNVYYEEVKAYLGDSCSRDARHFRAEDASSSNADDGLVLSMLDGEEVPDQFGGATVWWSAHSSVIRRIDDDGGGEQQQQRLFKLHYHERHRSLVLDAYLAYVQQQGRRNMVNNRKRKLFATSFSGDHRAGWSHVRFKHPMEFDKLAMDPATKKAIMDDLDAFKNGKEHYERVGKVWKRGYLLYGPPGTGKSSMIAAMANHLGYDVYIIELTSVKSNSDLHNLLMQTKNKAIIAIEDIDSLCDLRGTREKRMKRAEDESYSKNKDETGTGSSMVTLSGVLNFIDGLWSACGEERIIVFTTNHVDMLDPALIRRGRMDKHIEMSYCGFEAFRFLAKRDLGVESHELFDVVRMLLEEVSMTPADVIEELTPKTMDDDADSCLQRLVNALTRRRPEENN